MTLTNLLDVPRGQEDRQTSKQTKKTSKKTSKELRADPLLTFDFEFFRYILGGIANYCSLTCISSHNKQ